MKRARIPSGFSLIELMVVLAVGTLLLGAAYGTLAISRISWESGETQVDLSQDVRKAMLRIVWDLQQTSTALVQGVPADGQTYPAITFAIPLQLNVNGTVGWDQPTSYTLGGLNGRQILRGGTVVANHIQNSTFRRQAATPNVVEITLVGQKTTVQGANIQMTLAGRAQVRN